MGRYSRRRVGPRRSGRAAAPGPPASCTAARTRRQPLAAYERLQGALAAHDVLTDRGRSAPPGVAGPWCSWSRRSQRASMPARIRRADANHKNELPGSPLRHVAAGSLRAKLWMGRSAHTAIRHTSAQGQTKRARRWSQHTGEGSFRPPARTLSLHFLYPYIAPGWMGRAALLGFARWVTARLPEPRKRQRNHCSIATQRRFGEWQGASVPRGVS